MGISVTNGIEVRDPGYGIYESYIQEELRKDEKRRHIGPHKVQEELLRLPDEIFEALYGGAGYSGKSFILTMLPIFRGFYKFTGFKGVIFRRKFPDLEREIIRLSKLYYPQTGATYNEQKHVWEWKEYQSYMDFGHVQHDSDIVNYDSSQYNYCCFDELTHFSGYPYHYMVGTRVRPSSSFNIAIVRNGTNPGGIGQNFVYERFVKDYEQGRKVLRDKGTRLLRIFIPATLEDNPFAAEYDPLYAQKMQILAIEDPALYRAKRYGDWHAFKGSVFTTFRPIRFPDEPENALHVCPYFEIPVWWPRIISVDWGKRAMCHALWGAISPKGRVYIYRERVWRGIDISFWATEIGQISETENIVTAVLCGSAVQDRGQGTIKDEVNTYSGMNFVSSQNTPGSRVATLQIAQNFLRWTPKPYREPEEEYNHEKAQLIYRKHGDEALKNYVNQFKKYEPEDVTLLPKIQILLQPGQEIGGKTLAPVLVETLPLAIYDEKKKEDIAEFDGDDPIDNFRYFCKFSERYMNGIGGEEVEHRKKIDEIVEEYHRTNDATRYYRRLEHVEATTSKEVVAVARRSSRR